MTYLFILPVAAALLATGFLLDIHAQPGHEQITVLTLSVVACLATILFVPQRRFSQGAWPRAALLDAAIVTALLVTAVITTQGNLVSVTSLFRIAAASLLLLSTGLALLAIAGRDNENARQFILVLFIALLAAPVYLAPIAELSGNLPWLTNAIVAMSPLSVFAVALDIDILRTSWFYEHSVLGSLRFSYPSWSTCVVTMSTLLSLTILPNLLINRRRVKTC